MLVEARMGNSDVIGMKSSSNDNYDYKLKADTKIESDIKFGDVKVIGYASSSGSQYTYDVVLEGRARRS